MNQDQATSQTQLDAAPQATVETRLTRPLALAWDAFVIVGALTVATLGNGRFGLGNMEILQVSLTYEQSPTLAYIEHLANNRRGPLWPFVLGLWTSLFGEGDAAVRSLSAVLFGAALLALYAAARPLLHRGARMAMVLLLMTNPIHVEFSRDARSYMMHLLLLGTALLLAPSVAETGSRRRAALLAVLCVLATLNHFVAGMFLLAGGVGYVMFYRHAPYFRRGIAALAVAGSACVAVMAVFRNAAAKPDYDHPIVDSRWWHEHYFYLGGDGYSYAILVAVAALVLRVVGWPSTSGDVAPVQRAAATLRGLFASPREVRFAGYAVFMGIAPACIAALIALTDFRPTRIDYFTPISALLFGFVGYVITRAPRAIGAAIVLAVAVVNGPILYGIFTEDRGGYWWRERGQHRDCFSLVASMPRDIERVLVLPDYMADGFRHYRRTGEITAHTFIGLSGENLAPARDFPFCYLIYSHRMDDAYIGADKQKLLEAAIGPDPAAAQHGNIPIGGDITYGCRRAP